MKVAVLQQPKKFAIEERPVPAAGAGEVVVRIAATAVCHTDLDMYLGHHPGVRYPVVLGHEATGTVACVGEGVSDLHKGQNVIINPVISCGTCDCCQRGDEHLCRNAGLFGREIEGSLSQYVRLLARYVFALPPHLPLAEATMIETLATVHHAQVRAGLKAGESVVILDDVITTGGSTLSAIEAARQAGLTVKRVIALIDREEGGRENIEKEVSDVRAVLTRTEVMAYYSGKTG